MKKTAFTLVEIMIVVAIIALISAIAIPNLISARKTANESAAKATLRSLMIAAETYSISYGGSYPANVTALKTYITSADSFCNKGVSGYSYSCTLASTGYNMTARPITFGVTGSINYSATTGGRLTPL